MPANAKNEGKSIIFIGFSASHLHIFTFVSKTQLTNEVLYSSLGDEEQFRSVQAFQKPE